MSEDQPAAGRAPEFDYSALLEIFLSESLERLDRMEALALELDQQPDQRELLNEMFRGLHTLKGDGASLGYSTLADLAHRAEDLLERIRQGEIRWDATASACLLRVLDIFRRLLALPREARTPDQEAAERELEVLAGVRTSALAAGSNALSSPGVEGAELPAPTTLRVPIATMDRLLDTVGEILVARESLHAALAALPSAEAAPSLERLLAADELHRDLQSLVMSARLVPLAPLFHSLRRVLRDAESRCGKLVGLAVLDHGIEVDARLVECLRAPLGHLVRNAVDHGIEEPAQREALGKPTRGTVTIEAELLAASLVVHVRDDGQGIDAERVARRARGLGHFVPMDPTPRQLLRLLASPGFSTATQLTDVSGRGVGLDAVARAVQLLRGGIDLEFSPGKGTNFSLRLPLAVSILDGFHVRAGGEDYILPLEQVRECHEAPDAALCAAARGAFELRGVLLPYVRLRSTLGARGARAEQESLLVVESEQRRYGILVDELVGACQCVVKALGGLLRGVPGVFGTTLLGSGRVALILDPQGLVASPGEVTPHVA